MKDSREAWKVRTEEGDDQAKSVGVRLHEQRDKSRGRDEERRDGAKPVTLETNDRISGRNNWSR